MTEFTNNPAFELWLEHEGDRQIGVAISTGQPEDPVYVWSGGEWARHPEGIQTADISNAEKDALRAYCREYQYEPADGDCLVVYVDLHYAVDVRTYRWGGWKWSLDHEVCCPLDDASVDDSELPS